MSRYAGFPPEYCFYCDAALARGRKELDHYPVPRSAGGGEVVTVCIVCDDQKDRFSIDSWSTEAVSEALSGLASGEQNRWTKLLIAKWKRVKHAHDHRHRQDTVEMIEKFLEGRPE